MRFGIYAYIQNRLADMKGVGGANEMKSNYINIKFNISILCTCVCVCFADCLCVCACLDLK